MNRRSSSISHNDNDSLRSLFKQGLGKLTQISTRDQAFKEVKTLILQNKTTSNLRIFLSVLAQNRNKHLESEINIIGFIVEKYGTGLLDPLDKQPSIQKTAFRITQMLIKSFSDSQASVQLACQKTWIQIYLSVLINEDNQLKKKLLFNNLQALINGGGGKISQTTAQFVIEGLLEASLNKQDHQFFKQIAKRTLVLFLKTTVIHFSSLTCLQSVLSFFGINNLIPLLQSIVAKVIQYIGTATPNSAGYKIKSEACNALGLIGQQIDKNGLQVYSRIVKCLQDLATDKVWAVQATGRKALNIWKQKKNEWEEEYLQKQEKYADQIDEEQFEQNNFQRPQQVHKTAQEFYKRADFQIENPKTQNYYQQGLNKNKQPQNNKSQSPGQKISQNFRQIQNKIQQNSRYLNNRSNQSPKRSLEKGQYKVSKTYNEGFYPQTNKQTYDSHNNNFLQKNTGIGGGNNVQSVQNFYQRQNNSKQTYAKKMEQIKKSIYNQNKTVPDSIEYDETIPWQEAKSLPNFKDIQKAQKTNKIQKNISQPVRKQVQPDNPDLMFVEQWQQIVQTFQKGHKQQAVKLLLQMDDDIYFLRFMLQHGQNLLQNLTRPTTSKLLKKMLAIQKTNFMEQMLFKMVGQTAKVKAGQLLTNSQNLQIIRNLQKCEKISSLQNVSVKVKNLYEKSLNS